MEVSSRRLAVDELLHLLRVARPLNRHLRESAVDLLEIVGAQFDVGRADVLFETMPFRRAGDRRDPRLLGQ